MKRRHVTITAHMSAPRDLVYRLLAEGRSWGADGAARCWGQPLAPDAAEKTVDVVLAAIT